MMNNHGSSKSGTSVVQNSFSSSGGKIQKTLIISYSLRWTTLQRIRSQSQSNCRTNMCSCIFPAQSDKMLKHSCTCHRVQVGVIPRGIVQDSTIELVEYADIMGELVRITGTRCAPDRGKTNFKAEE